MPNCSSRNLYETLMIKNREAESKRQNDIREYNKYFRDSAIKASQEKRWTSEKFVNHSMISYLMSDKDAIKEKLNLKREKLRNLFREESKFYEYALSQALARASPPCSNSDNGYEYENNALQCEDIGQSGFDMNSSTHSNLERDTLVDRVNGFDHSCGNSEASGELQSNGTTLDQKMDELRNFDLESKELENIEREILDHRQNLLRLMDERKEMVESRLQRSFEKMILRPQPACLIRRSRQVQDDLTSDLAWLDRLLTLEDKEEGSQLNDAKKILEEVLQRERRREADIHNLLSSELSELSRNEVEEWRNEADARDKLLNDVIIECQERVNSRLRALNSMKSELEERYARLMNETEVAEESSQAHKQLEKESVDECRPQISSPSSGKNNYYINDISKLNNNSETINRATVSNQIEIPVPNHRRKKHLW